MPESTYPAIEVQLTTRCNLRCTHCYVETGARDMPLERVEEIAAFAKERGCTHLSFTGGEPTLHPQFARVLRVTADRGLTFALVSNGWGFADVIPTIARFAAASGQVDFSLDGAEESVHDAVRAPGAFRRVLQAADLCRSHSIAFGFRVALTRRNAAQMEAMARLARGRGALEITFIPLLPTPRAVAEQLLLPPGDLHRAYSLAQRLQEASAPMKVTLAAGFFSVNGLSPCPTLAWDALFVSADERLSFCCQLAGHACGERDTEVVADLRSVSLREAARRMAEARDAFKAAKARDHAAGRLSTLDYFPCWSCLKRFGKVGWMAGMPDNPWSRDLADGVARELSPVGKRTEAAS
jgi:pyruvate-formate lyase-activating enzyme